MATKQDTYADATLIGSQQGSEVEGGLLTSIDIDGGTCLTFEGSVAYVAVGNAGSVVRTVCFWMWADDSTSRGLIELSSGNHIDIGTNAITSTGLTGVKYWVNAIEDAAAIIAGR